MDRWLFGIFATFSLGAYELSFRATSGKTVADQGKLLEIWKKQPDGSWKCIVDTWNSDLPASPPTTS